MSKRPQTASKRKKPNVNEEELKCCSLNVMIHRAEDIDIATRNSMPNAGRIYMVYGWIESEVSTILTHATPGLPDPEWQHIFTVELGKYKPDRFLHLEVMRTRPLIDPSCSNGIAIVGRAKIPFPKLGEQKTARYGLVMQDGFTSSSDVGHIYVTLELLRM